MKNNGAGSLFSLFNMPSRNLFRAFLAILSHSHEEKKYKSSATALIYFALRISISLYTLVVSFFLFSHPFTTSAAGWPGEHFLLLLRWDGKEQNGRY